MGSVGQLCGRVAFPGVGGLPAADVTLGAFAAALVGINAMRGAVARDEVARHVTLVESLNFRAAARSGVNVDEELANLILFQNAYQASARVITVAQQLFDDLIAMIR